jgi:hypothetical protein
VSQCSLHRAAVRMMMIARCTYGSDRMPWQSTCLIPLTHSAYLPSLSLQVWQDHALQSPGRPCAAEPHVWRCAAAVQHCSR